MNDCVLISVSRPFTIGWWVFFRIERLVQLIKRCSKTKEFLDIEASNRILKCPPTSYRRPEKSVYFQSSNTVSWGLQHPQSNLLPGGGRTAGMPRKPWPMATQMIFRAITTSIYKGTSTTICWITRWYQLQWDAMGCEYGIVTLAALWQVLLAYYSVGSQQIEGTFIDPLGSLQIPNFHPNKSHEFRRRSSTLRTGQVRCPLGASSKGWFLTTKNRQPNPAVWRFEAY